MGALLAERLLAEQLLAEPWTGTMPGRLEDETDLELVSRSKRGNADAFSTLVRRHEHVVFNLSFRFMRDTALAEDMAQEAFLKAFRLLNGFRGDCSFSTWMYRVTTSVCLTELNRRKKRGEVELTSDHGGTTDEHSAESGDRAAVIRRCVTKLPDRYASIVTLYYLNEMPYEEIAAIMEIPMGTLKTWMFRARKELRGIVEQELGADAIEEL